MARILVVGTEAWQEDVAAHLSCAGHEVTLASDGLVAAELALGMTTAAIVTQRTLPGISGLQLCRLVNAERPFQGIPVVVMSGDGEPGAAFQARAAGASAHVDDIEQLRRVLPGLLARAELGPIVHRRGDRTTLGRRLSEVLDRALRDGVIAADVRALAAVDGLEGMFTGLLELASQVLPYTWLGLVVRGERSTFLLHAAADDADAEREAREVLGVDDVTSCTHSTGAAPRSSSIAGDAREAIEVPIFFGDCQVGQLAVVLPPSDDGDIKRVVGLIAYELGGALKLVSLVDQVKRQAATDTLTGLLNRRAFLDLVFRERARSERSGAPTSFLLVDVDHFKRVNDVHGHAAGDAVLRGIARAFEDATRRSDIVSRWGGEEFVIGLPETSLVDAVLVAERIRARIEETTHDLPGGGALFVTASIGVSTGAGAWGSEHLLAAADAALYQAKATGRNRVCSAPALGAEPFALDAAEVLRRAS